MAVLRNKKGFTRKRDWVQYVMNFIVFMESSQMISAYFGSVGRKA